MLEKQAKVGRVRPYCSDRGGIYAAENKSLLLSIESNGVAFFSSRVFVTVDAAPCGAQAARVNVQKTNPLRLPLQSCFSFKENESDQLTSQKTVIRI